MARLPKPSGLRRTGFLVAFLVGSLVANAGCLAYTAAGDRIFAPAAILPQIAPTDQLYGWAWTLPLSGKTTGTRRRTTNIGAFFDKTITERLSLHFQGNWLRIDRIGADSRHGFANFESGFKYLAINDHDRELLLTLGVNREWGATGAGGVGASPKGATEPRVYFGKGLGDLDIFYLRPLAVTGFLGYQFSDARPRPDLVRAGFAVQYSIPYLQSKVQSFDLPHPVRGLTPMTEILVATPAGRSYGARTTVLIAPGLSYAGEGWELVLAALLPATRATGDGAGVRAQLHLVLDYLFPQTIGHPLFGLR
ncbi:MAG: hypothetical protein AB7H90_02805 [Alphaproteobacteria bacterium]